MCAASERVSCSESGSACIARKLHNDAAAAGGPSAESCLRPECESSEDSQLLQPGAKLDRVAACVVDVYVNEITHVVDPAAKRATHPLVERDWPTECDRNVTVRTCE